MLKTTLVFASLLVAMVQATIMDAAFKVGDVELHGAVLSGRVHITVPTDLVGEAFDWLLDGDVVRRDAGNGVMSGVRSGVNTFALNDGAHTVAIRSPAGAVSNAAAFHVDNTRTSLKTVSHSSDADAAVASTPAAIEEALVRQFDTSGLFDSKKKKRKKKAKKALNNGQHILAYDQYGNPMYGSDDNTASGFHNTHAGSSNLGLNNGDFGGHGGFDAEHPGPNMHPAGQDFSGHQYTPGSNNAGMNGNQFGNNWSNSGGNQGMNGGGFGAATTVLNPATGGYVTIQDSTMQNCRNQGMAYYSVQMNGCTNEAFTNGQQNTAVPMNNNNNNNDGWDNGNNNNNNNNNGWDNTNNGGGFGGGNAGTREDEPECIDASETCIINVCRGTPGMAGNTNLAPGLIAPGVMAQCTNGNKCVSFTDPSDYTCPMNYRPCCENPGFSRTTWIVIGVAAAAFVLIVVVAVTIRARNVGRQAGLGNMRSLMSNMDSSDSSIFLSNSIQRNPARY